MPAIRLSVLLSSLLLLFPFSTLTAQKGSKKGPVADNFRFDPLKADHPAPDAPEYPLHAHIFSIHSGGANATYRGYGSGNLLGGVAVQGFDFAFDCAAPFLADKKPEAAYPARWKSEPHELELLMLAPDDQRQDTCKLKVTLRATPIDPAQAVFLGNGDEKVKPDYVPGDFADARLNPAYPLQFHIKFADHIQQLNHGAHGHGYGFLLDQPDREYKFHYECDPGLVANTQKDDFYQARWLRQDTRLEVLTRPAGSDKSHQCVFDLEPSVPKP